MILAGHGLAIDPGTEVLGWAYFFEGRLRRAGLSEVRESGDIGYVQMSHAIYIARTLQVSLDWVAVEHMKSYNFRQQKGDQNDLITLAKIGDFVAGYLRPSRTFHKAPAEWKGQMDKDVSHRRIEDRLTPEEREVLNTLPPPSKKGKGKRHNALDAIGLGLCVIWRRA